MVTLDAFSQFLNIIPNWDIIVSIEELIRDMKKRAYESRKIYNSNSPPYINSAVVELDCSNSLTVPQKNQLDQSYFQIKPCGSYNHQKWKLLQYCNNRRPAYWG